MSGLARLLTWILLIKGLRGSRRAGSSRPAPRLHPSSHDRHTRGNPSSTRQAGHASDRGDRDEPVPTQRSGEPGPDSPLDLQPTDWKATLKRTATEIKDDRVTLAAAGMAYYFFLSIFPALIAFVGVLGLFNIDTEPVVQSIRDTLPGGSGVALTDAVSDAGDASQAASLTATIAGIAVALWSASSGMVALQGGLNIAYDVPRDRKLIGKRAVALALIIATGLLGGVPSPLFAFGDSWLFTALGWLLTLVAVSVLFSIYYFLGPNRASPTWQWVSVGGLVGMVLWVVASIGFGLYVEGLGDYAKTYGELAAVVVLILWLFLSSLAVLIGGELNAEVERQSERRTQPA